MKKEIMFIVKQESLGQSIFDQSNGVVVVLSFSQVKLLDHFAKIFGGEDKTFFPSTCSRLLIAHRERIF